MRWVAARENFFLPVRVLSRLFRNKYLAYLREAYRERSLVLVGSLQDLAAPGTWHAFIADLQRIDWVVYAKPPFGSPEQVLKYLARYTHRVAISNRRFLSLGDGQVAFRYKDYRTGRGDRVMRLSAVEFIRRFLLHVLPKRFVRIRHFGLLANRRRKDNLALCRRRIPMRTEETRNDEAPSDAQIEVPSTLDDRCPRCELGHMVIVAELPPSRAGPILSKEAFCHA